MMGMSKARSRRHVLRIARLSRQHEVSVPPVLRSAMWRVLLLIRRTVLRIGVFAALSAVFPRLRSPHHRAFQPLAITKVWQPVTMEASLEA